MKIKFTRNNKYFQKGMVLEGVTNFDYEIINGSSFKITIWYIESVNPNIRHIFRRGYKRHITLCSDIDAPTDFWFEILDDIEEDEKYMEKETSKYDKVVFLQDCGNFKKGDVIYNVEEVIVYDFLAKMKPDPEKKIEIHTVHPLQVITIRHEGLSKSIIKILPQEEEEINMKEIIVEEKQPVVTYQKLREKNACEKGLLKVMDRFGEELFSGVDYSDMHKYISTNMSTSDFDWFIKNFSLKEEDEKCVLFYDFFVKDRTDKGILVLYKNDCFYFMYESTFNVYSLVQYNTYLLLLRKWDFNDIKKALNNTGCKIYWFSSMKDAVDFIEKSKDNVTLYNT